MKVFTENRTKKKAKKKINKTGAGISNNYKVDMIITQTTIMGKISLIMPLEISSRPDVAFLLLTRKEDDDNPPRGIKGVTGLEPV